MRQQSLFPDTIFALSSGALPSGVAIVRLSGPHVRQVLSVTVGTVPQARRATLRTLRDGDGIVLDRGLVLFFDGTASFTGEDCAELHLHGGRATVAAVLAWLGSLSGLRMADAGEFTRRAFLNGRIDLTGAEALADLVAAETESQRRLALDNASGAQRELYSGWRRRLLHARAMIEAELDFADEPDIPGSVSESVWSDMDRLCAEIEDHLAGFTAAEMVREGFRVVLVGPPNAGKSSLLNTLARRDVAIVTDKAGTTRDLIEVALDLRGIKVMVIDTAGLRESTDEVERIGIGRARDAAGRADLVLSLVEPEQDEAEQLDPRPGGTSLRVGTKSDLGDRYLADVERRISAHTGDGIGELLACIEEQARLMTSASGTTVPSRRRHVDLLQTGLAHLRTGVAAADMPVELRAEELRAAEHSLGRIIGAVDVEDLLGEIFAQFCVGK